jgi:sporulation protein YlmC with PRC-barrel domain
MTTIALRPVPRGVRRRSPHRHHRKRRLTGNAELLSVAGLLGSPVLVAGGRTVGRIEDLVIGREPAEPHPRLRGAIVRHERSRHYAPTDTFDALRADGLSLAGPLPAESEPTEVIPLGHGVLDRQIVDAEGTDVTRVSDLVLGRTADGIRLVGVDVSARTLLRRLGPARLRRHIARDRVYDWASVAAFSEHDPDGAGDVLRLTAASASLRHHGPADLDALLAELPPKERTALADTVQET